MFKLHKITSYVKYYDVDMRVTDIQIVVLDEYTYSLAYVLDNLFIVFPSELK